MAHARRVCSAAPSGYAACDALVGTRGDGVTPSATTSYQSGFSPAQLRKAYGISGNGTTTVAVVDAYANPYAASDLDAYRTQFQLGAANLTQVNQTGDSISTVKGDVGWGQEEMLDLEMVSAMCPTCPILYVGANSASFNDLAAAVNLAVSKGAKVVSNSYGGNEISGSSISNAYDHQGVAITVSSGDNGYGVESPASFKTVVAVGGTSLKVDGSTGLRSSETAWSGAGSGCSSYALKPTWQSSSVTNCSRRAVADVSAVADPNTGVAVYDSYGSTGGANWMVFGGTSVAAPIIGGIYGVTGNTAGYPAQKLYSSAAALFDVISGSNGRCTRGKNTSGANLCTAVAGWDGPTGMGAPLGTGAF